MALRQKGSAVKDDSKMMGMLAHLTALMGGMAAGVGSWVGPLIIFLIKKDDDAFAAEHAKEALNFNLTLMLLVVLGAVVSIATIGLALLIVVPLGIVIGVLWLIWTIQAAMRANDGQPYRYPLNIRFIS